MREVITKVVKEGSFFHRRKVEKVGLEGTDLYDRVDNKSEDLVCFYNAKDKYYYLHSLISGKLVAKSLHFIKCKNNGYFLFTFTSEEPCLYHINHGENAKESEFNECTKFKGITVYSNGTRFVSNKFSIRDNMLIQYMSNKEIGITDIISNKNWNLSLDGLPDSDVDSIYFNRKFHATNIYEIKITCNNHDIYFNLFDAAEGKLLYNEWGKRGILHSKLCNNKLYIITYYTELLDPNGKVLIPSFYNSISFHETLPFVYLIKNGKKGLANLEGEIIFDSIYDEIMETPEKFIVNVCETKEYTKKGFNK